MTNVYASTCSQTNWLHSAKFYATLELARKRLKEMADERRYRLGVHCFNEVEDKFSYLIGWEEVSVTFPLLKFLWKWKLPPKLLSKGKGSKMHLSRVYYDRYLWVIVYHTSVDSEEVEMIKDKTFETEKEAWNWFHANHRIHHFIQPEAVRVHLAGLNLSRQETV